MAENKIIRFWGCGWGSRTPGLAHVCGHSFYFLILNIGLRRSISVRVASNVPRFQSFDEDFIYSRGMYSHLFLVRWVKNVNLMEELMFLENRQMPTLNVFLEPVTFPSTRNNQETCFLPKPISIVFYTDSIYFFAQCLPLLLNRDAFFDSYGVFTALPVESCCFDGEYPTKKYVLLALCLCFAMISDMYNAFAHAGSFCENANT